MDDRFIEYSDFIKCKREDCGMVLNKKSSPKEWEEAKKHFKEAHTESCWK